MSPSGIIVLIKSGREFRTLSDNLARLFEKSSLFIRVVKSLTWDPIFEKKRVKNEIERRDVNESIKKTLIIRDLRYRSILSTLGRKIVVKRKENTNIPIIEAKNGKIFQASPPIMSTISNL